MKPNMISFLSALVFFHLLSFATFNFSFCSGSNYVGCIPREREALLRFKQDLTDPSNRLASWIGDGDCCKWAGVVCDNFTGHVLQLNLRNPHVEYFTSVYYSRFGEEYAAYNRSKLGGKINPSLLELKDLIHLDLSSNDFKGIQIPRFLGSMENLRYLNLSRAGFGGMIPQQLGNLSNLQYLDLYGCYELYVENLMWISSLTLLKYLDLSGVDLNNTSNQWLLKLNSLLFLEILRLSWCGLQHSPQISIANFSSLTVLDLSGNSIDNSLIPNWIFGLNHLVFLDLGGNDFQGPIPNGLENLTSLTHLDLSGNDFQGPILNGLRNLTFLTHLDLSGNDFQGPIPNGLENLTSLIHLDLSSNFFNSTIPNWLSRISYLEYLSLGGNNLCGSISRSSLCNLTSLRYLDLSSNFFNSSIPDWLSRFGLLEHLSLGNNTLQGKIPRSLGRLCNLRSIFIFDVNLSQNISEVLDVLSGCVSNTLESLVLNQNRIFGHLIPSSLRKLSSLKEFDLAYNKLNGTLSQAHFANLTRLRFFSISENSISLIVNSNWLPSFQLLSLSLRSCHVGPYFPSWLISQKSLQSLDISNTGISDAIPNWFWKTLSQTHFCNISHNQIFGKIPNLIDVGLMLLLDLSSNKFSGPLPQMSLDVNILDLSDNNFSGSIFPFLCQGTNETRSIEILNIENNSLSGELPNCWMNWQDLKVLNLGNNKFTGNLSTSMESLYNLQSLILRQNGFFGVVPFVSLINCTKLETFDVAENQFGGNVPTWIGERFAKLKILNLRSNKFHGLLPTELCRLASLQILDLAENNLSGILPSCFDNFIAMVTVNDSAGNDIFYRGNKIDIRFQQHAWLVWKGTRYEYYTTLNLVRAMDLSRNNFSGVIPTEVASLRSLNSLNLSHNSFVGNIPEGIGDMISLDSMDFSANQLSGEIPQNISKLTFLSYLNLSNNKLTGKIPSSTQLQSFDTSSFTGNDLCGPPLVKNCTVTVPPELENNLTRRGSIEVDWFYVSMALGFVVGFWGVIGPLIVNRRWRYSYCLFLDRFEDKFCSVIQKLF